MRNRTKVPKTVGLPIAGRATPYPKVAAGAECRDPLRMPTFQFLKGLFFRFAMIGEMGHADARRAFVAAIRNFEAAKTLALDNDLRTPCCASRALHRKT